MKHGNAVPKSSQRRMAAGRAGACACPRPERAVTLPGECACVDDRCRFCEAKLYSGLSAQHVQALRGCLINCTRGPREVLFRAGDPCTDLYLIREGQVKLAREDVDGRELLLNLAGPGFFLGFDNIGNANYSYSVETLTPTVFCRVRHVDIMRLLTEAPRVSLNILLAVNEQLAQARGVIRALGQKSAVEKVAALLLTLCPQKASLREQDKVLHLSRHEMAEILGLTMETVSRIMAEFRRKKIIHAPRGRISVSHRARLEALAGDPLCAETSKGSNRSRRNQPQKQERDGSQNLRLS